MSVKKVLLLDSSVDLDTIEKFVNDKNIEIISFDYNIHNYLLNKKIPHLISEQFLTNQDTATIDKQIYQFSSWYDNKNVSQFLQFEGLNIGKLFHDDTLDFLLKFLKKFYEIKAINKHYADVLFLSHGLIYNILCMFTTSISKIQNKEKLQLTYDKVKINFELFNHEITLSLSQSLYLRLKSLYEYFSSFIYNSKVNGKTKRTLLVEINTTRFKQLFLKSKNSPIKFAYYGRRRPAVWNFETYAIIRKSRCRIITRNMLTDKTFDSELQKNADEIKSKLSNVWTNIAFFTNFFSIEGISFWNIVEPVLKNLIDERIEKTIFEIKLIQKLFIRYSFDCILVLSEIGFTEQIIINQAKKTRTPIILLQHGLYSDTLESLPDNRSKGVYMEAADYFAVWGEITNQSAQKFANIPTNKIKVLGSPIYDDLFSGNTINDSYVLVTTQPPQHEIIYGLKVSNMEKIEQSIITIANIVSKKKKKLIVKLHPSLNELDTKEISKKVGFDVKIISAGNAISLIRNCSVLIVLGHSTTTLEGQILKKPVITIPIIDYNRGNPPIFDPNLSFTCDIESIDNVLNQLFSDKQFKEMIIERGQKFVKEYLVDIGDGSKNLLEFIQSVRNQKLN